MSGAVVCLSGGQDSSTCLFHAVRRYHLVHAVSFDYGQRHRVELECATALAARAGVEQVVLPVDALSRLAGGSLTNPAIESRLDAAGTGNAYAERRGLPSSFVPGRNIIFLGLAAAYGIPRGLETLVAGVCSTDEAGYPDCRPEFVQSLEQTIRIGMDCPEFAIDAPLLHLTKARHLGAGRGARRGRVDPHRDPHLLRGRAGSAACLGLRLRRLPRLHHAGARMGRVCGPYKRLTVTPRPLVATLRTMSEHPHRHFARSIGPGCAGLLAISSTTTTA